MQRPVRKGAGDPPISNTDRRERGGGCPSGTLQQISADACEHMERGPSEFPSTAPMESGKSASF